MDTDIKQEAPELKQAEQEQVQQAQESEQLNPEVEKYKKELENFVYIISHDLKAPLRGISTVAKWIADDYSAKLGKEGKEQMDLLLNRVQRLNGLIDGVLQYSRVGRIKEEPVQINLNELVTAVIETIALPENIKITIEGELPTIVAEQNRIVQVFQNLLSNAVRFMDKPQGLIKVSCIEEDDFWKFSVEDNGPGIEEKDFERIFKMFQTLAPRDEVESVGAGLTITKKIVEVYDGEIWVESKPGHGTTFFFSLPKRKMGVKNEEHETDTAGRG